MRRAALALLLLVAGCPGPTPPVAPPPGPRVAPADAADPEVDQRAADRWHAEQERREAAGATRGAR